MAEFHRTNFLSEARPAERQVVLHYHIFKNAGTSVDAILRDCFADGFMTVDGPVPEFFINQTEVNVMVRNRAQVKALSSHQIRLPVPTDRRLAYCPIIFIRRPELRIQSMWRFQRSRNDSHPATRLAKQLDFADWVRFHLEERAQAPLMNQQSLLFSFEYDRRTPVNHPDILDRAIANIDSLPFVGIVEHFEESMKMYQRLYQPGVPDLQVDRLPQLNRTTDQELESEEQIERFQHELGAELFSELSERMHMDLELYRRCVEGFEGLRHDCNGRTA